MREIFFTVNKENYLTGISYSIMDYAIRLEIPDDHEIFNSDASVFKYENGELIKDEAYQQQLIEEEQEQQNRPSDDEMNAIAILELTEKIMGGV